MIRYVMMLCVVSLLSGCATYESWTQPKYVLPPPPPHPLEVQVEPQESEAAEPVGPGLAESCIGDRITKRLGFLPHWP